MTAVSLVWCARCDQAAVLNVYVHGPAVDGLEGAYCLDHADPAAVGWFWSVGFFDCSSCEGAGHVDGEPCRTCADRFEEVRP